MPSRRQKGRGYWAKKGMVCFTATNKKGKRYTVCFHGSNKGKKKNNNKASQSLLSTGELPSTITIRKNKKKT